MPITKSAKKALRQSARRQVRNLQKKRAYKGVIRTIKQGGEETKDLIKEIPALYKALDKAAKTNAIHRNKASRLKSRITKLVAKLLIEKPVATKKRKPKS